MAIFTKTIQIKSKGENDVMDVTTHTLKAIEESNLKDGILTVFVSGSTAAMTTIEYEPGLRNDFPMMLKRIIPKDIEYEHDTLIEELNEGELSSQKRKPITRTHDFRKFVNTTFINARLNDTIRNMLLGHSTDLDDVYYKPKPDDLLQEY